MSVYSKKGKGWRYDFTMKGQRATEAWFPTKKEAKAAEAKRREELKNPVAAEEIPTDMGFLDLINNRLDYMNEYLSDSHVRDNIYMGRRWVKEWDNLPCSEITRPMVEKFILQRAKVSHHTANKEVRCLRAAFNYGKERELIQNNPLDGIKFLPVEKKIKRVPTSAEIDKVIAVAEPNDQDYLWIIRDTLARVSEVNRLEWADIDFENNTVALYTRKKKGGHLTPRLIPMTKRLAKVLSRRYKDRDPDKQLVFWHRYWSSKAGAMVEGPYQDRKKLMRVLCNKAGVYYFRYHAIRHSGASLMDNNAVPTIAIQKILGHENRRTTEIYLHSMGSTEKDAMRVFEEIG